MKKIKHSIIAVVLVFSLLTGVFSINSVALQPGPDCEKVSHHFFEEIGNSVPANVRGSCVYVALTMMLQFYDFYWNDDFVDDSYVILKFIKYNAFDNMFLRLFHR